jgi:hypothetical protein
VNTVKRVFYGYLLRDFNFASLELLLGIPLIAGGTWFGVAQWLAGSRANLPSTSGTVMLAALPVILGVQLLIGFLGFDMHNTPRQPIHPRLEPAPLSRP